MSLMEFREIYDGYRVSPCGVVLSKRGLPLAHSDNGRGYPVVSVYISGKRTSKGVHRVVAEAWLPNPEGLPEVNHRDSNRSNFYLDNLEWCTHGYNIEYSYKEGYRTAKGEENARCVTDENTVREICGLLQAGCMPAAIRDLGYDYGRVRAIKRRQNWTYISQHYNF